MYSTKATRRKRRQKSREPGLVIRKLATAGGPRHVVDHAARENVLVRLGRLYSPVPAMAYCWGRGFQYSLGPVLAWRFGQEAAFMTNVQVQTRVCGAHMVAAMIGELDATEAATAAAAVAVLTAAGQRLIIDLRTLKFIDCHAVSALLGARMAARQAGGDVLLAAPHGSVLRLLTLLGVPGVHASVADAESAACGQPAVQVGSPEPPCRLSG